MQRKRSHRHQIALRSFTYGVMSVAVLAGILFCLAWVKGFRINLASQEISQVSLLQLRSLPSGANVVINDKEQSFKTPARQNVKTGQVDVKMYKKGYHDWTRSVNLQPDEIRWLDYARLVPRAITTDSIKSFTSVDSMLPSPDRHWIMLFSPETPHGLTLADISNPKNVRFSTITIPESALPRPNETPPETVDKLEIVEWDSSSRFVLIRRTLGEKIEYIKLDRKNPAMARNLTTDFNMNISEPHFTSKDSDVIYGLTGQDIRKFNTHDQSVSAPLVSGVTSYHLYGDGKLTYVSEKKSDSPRQIVGVYSDGKNQIIRTFNEIVPTHAEFTHYYDKDYLAIGRGETVTIISSPLSDQVGSGSAVKISSEGGIDFMDFNGSGRFVIAGRGDKIVSYDIEKGEEFRFVMSGLGGKAPQWLDDYYLIDNNGGNIALVEFDGANRNTIVSGRGKVTLSHDDKYLYSLGSVASGMVLQRSKMIVD